MGPTRTRIPAWRQMQREEARKARESGPESQEVRMKRMITEGDITCGPEKESNPCIIYCAVKLSSKANFKIEVQYPCGTVRPFSDSQSFGLIMKDYENTKLIFTRVEVAEKYEAMRLKNKKFFYEHMPRSKEFKVTIQFKHDKSRLFQNIPSSQEKIKFLTENYDYFTIGFTPRTSIEFGDAGRPRKLEGDLYAKLKDIITMNTDTQYEICIPPPTFCVPPNDFANYVKNMRKLVS